MENPQIKVIVTGVTGMVGEGVMLDDAQVEGVIEGVGEGVADKEGEGELERVPGS